MRKETGYQFDPPPTSPALDETQTGATISAPRQIDPLPASLASCPCERQPLYLKPLLERHGTWLPMTGISLPVGSLIPSSDWEGWQ